LTGEETRRFSGVGVAQVGDLLRRQRRHWIGQDAVAGGEVDVLRQRALVRDRIRVLAVARRGRQHAVEDVAQIDRCDVEAGQVDVEGDGRDAEVRPQRDVRQRCGCGIGELVGRRHEVAAVDDREHRRHPDGVAEIDLEVRQQQRRGRYGVDGAELRACAGRRHDQREREHTNDGTV
jgi:hypothetical protein